MLISAKLAPTFSYETLERFWRDADECGYHAVWDYDHFYGLADPSVETLEGWTLLGAMATIVKRARIGCMVTGVTYRNPAMLANMAVTVDHISGGRLEFGIGAAWHEPEHRSYGFDFPKPGVRIEMLDEALHVVKKLWTEDIADFKGRYFTLNEARCLPKPLQKPHPPIVVGASGPKNLRVVARHANEWNTPGHEPEAWAAMNRTLDEACAEVGRDPKEIRRSVQLFIFPKMEGNVEEQLAKLKAYEDLGCEHVVLSFYDPPDRGVLERAAPA